MKQFFLLIAICLLVLVQSCSYNVPLIRFEIKSQYTLARGYSVTQEHHFYRYMRITGYGLSGYAHKISYSTTDSSGIDSIVITKGSVRFNASTTMRKKTVIYDAFGNHRIVVKIKSRTHGQDPATYKRVTKMYVPIRRIRIVERY